MAQKNPRFRRLHSCLGRVTRFELANAWFTARCVRPLHHTRQMLNYNNLFIQSLSKCFLQNKNPTRPIINLRGVFVQLEFDNFVAYNDCDEVNNPPNPAKEDGDKNPNNHHCPVLVIDFFDDTIDHPG